MSYYKTGSPQNKDQYLKYTLEIHEILEDERSGER